jgi:hypothetical protein
VGLLAVLTIVLFFVPLTTCNRCEGLREETWNGPNPITGVRWIDHALAAVPGFRSYIHIDGRIDCPYCHGTGDVSIVNAIRSRLGTSRK